MENLNQTLLDSLSDLPEHEIDVKNILATLSEYTEDIELLESLSAYIKNHKDFKTFFTKVYRAALEGRMHDDDLDMLAIKFRIKYNNELNARIMMKLVFRALLIAIILGSPLFLLNLDTQQLGGGLVTISNLTALGTFYTARRNGTLDVDYKKVTNKSNELIAILEGLNAEFDLRTSEAFTDYTSKHTDVISLKHLLEDLETLTPKEARSRLQATYAAIISEA